MTADDIIKWLPKPIFNEFTDASERAYDEAIEIIRRSEPEGLIKERIDKNYHRLVCPACMKPLFIQCSFCPSCGKALRWEVKNERDN